MRNTPDASACSPLALDSVLPWKRCLRGAVALLCPVFAAPFEMRLNEAML